MLFARRDQDVDSSGCIDAKELRPALEQLGLNASAKQVRELLAKYDEDGSGSIERQEFLAMVRSAEEEVNNVRVAEARAEAVAKAKPGMKQEAGEAAAAKMEARIRVEAEAAAAAPPRGGGNNVFAAVMTEARSRAQDKVTA